MTARNDLVARLRAAGNAAGYGGWAAGGDLELDAADRIEALEAALRDARGAMQPLLQGCDRSVWHDVGGEQMKRILVAPTAIDRTRATLARIDALLGDRT